jgi:hypothetical protein
MPSRQRLKNSLVRMSNTNLAIIIRLDEQLGNGGAKHFCGAASICAGRLRERKDARSQLSCSKAQVAPSAPGKRFRFRQDRRPCPGGKGNDGRVPSGYPKGSALSWAPADRRAIFDYAGMTEFWRDVLEAGFSCGLHKIERLMRTQALWARPRRRTLSKDDGERPASAIAPNVLDRQFRADHPNCKWIADFTMSGQPRGWLYVVAVTDLFSRRVVGGPMKAKNRHCQTPAGGSSATIKAKQKLWLDHYEGRPSGEEGRGRAPLPTEALLLYSIRSASRCRDISRYANHLRALAQPI